jgi:hypothetical protein
MAMPTNRLDREYDKFIEDASGKTAVNTNLVVQDIEIGAVEIKDHTSTDRASVNSNNALKTIEEVPGTPYNNQFTVATSGTAVQLQTSANLSLTIKALAGNTGLIYVGDSTVDSTNGFELSAGDSVSIAVSNNNVIWIDASVSGEKVCVIAVS